MTRGEAWADDDADDEGNTAGRGAGGAPEASVGVRWDVCGLKRGLGGGCEGVWDGWKCCGTASDMGVSTGAEALREAGWSWCDGLEGVDR